MFDFIMQQILGMQWLSKLIWQLLESGFGATQASPMVDLASMLMLMSFFRSNFAVAYVIMGLVLAVVGGLLIDALGMERYLRQYNDPIREFYLAPS